MTSTGQRSSRVIEKRCHDDVGFRYLAAGAAPDFGSIARFPRRHLEALAGLLRQALRLCQKALRLCQKARMVRLGKVALDGTKAARERQPAQGDELPADGGEVEAAGGGDRPDAGRGGAPGRG